MTKNDKKKLSDINDNIASLSDSLRTSRSDKSGYEGMAFGFGLIGSSALAVYGLKLVERFNEVAIHPLLQHPLLQDDMLLMTSGASAFLAYAFSCVASVAGDKLDKAQEDKFTKVKEAIQILSAQTADVDSENSLLISRRLGELSNVIASDDVSPSFADRVRNQGRKVTSFLFRAPA